MKMKPIYQHSIYLSIILILGFQYWSKLPVFDATLLSLSRIDMQLEKDGKILISNCDNIKSLSKWLGKINPNIYGGYWISSKETDSICSRCYQYLEVCKHEFLNQYGDTSVDILKMPSSNSKTALYFNKDKIQNIRNQLFNVKNALIYNIADSFYRKKLVEIYKLPVLCENESYWESIKSLAPINTYTELTNIQNLILNDETAFLNYNVDKIGCCRGCSFYNDNYRASIIPTRLPIIEGEAFESDIYLSKLLKDPLDCTIEVDGKHMPVKNGVAHFISTPQTIGKKLIKIIATMKNPKNDSLMTLNREFEYEVLPKCSRDCQQ